MAESGLDKDPDSNQSTLVEFITDAEGSAWRICCFKWIANIGVSDSCDKERKNSLVSGALSWVSFNSEYVNRPSVSAWSSRLTERQTPSGPPPSAS